MGWGWEVGGRRTVGCFTFTRNHLSVQSLNEIIMELISHR